MIIKYIESLLVFYYDFILPNIYRPCTYIECTYRVSAKKGSILGPCLAKYFKGKTVKLSCQSGSVSIQVEYLVSSRWLLSVQCGEAVGQGGW